MKNGFLWLDYHMVTTASKILLLLFSCSVMSNSLWPHGLLHVRFPCPLPSPRVCSNSHPLCWWWHPTPSWSVAPFFSCLQSFPASGSFSKSQFFAFRCPEYWNFRFSISPSNEYWGLISFRIDWFDVLSVQEPSPTLQFKSINSLACNSLYGSTVTCIHDYWKKW